MQMGIYAVEGYHFNDMLGGGVYLVHKARRFEWSIIIF